MATVTYNNFMGILSAIEGREGKFIVLLFLVFVSGCVSEKVEVQNVVVAYNRQLTEAYAKGTADGLELYASPKEITRIASGIEFHLKDRRALVNEMLAFDFISADKTDSLGFVVVTTRERWRAYFVDVRTRKPLNEESDSDYEGQYRVKRYNGRWVVDSVILRELED